MSNVIKVRCDRKGCRRIANHLLLPQKQDLCMEHYREARPYRLDVAAYATFRDMLSKAERAKWRKVMKENEQHEEG